ncbi:response regulator transcription factor [Amycolatopsis sp. NPDC051371]|uniref:response regulator transcription factor n=1 Tax=Amycolatopsis sp. NPDC051371 TaxID=3155800 RepID=UPI00341F706F
MTSTQILVVDDHPVVRDGVKLLLRPDTGLVVTASPESGRAAIERSRELRPDIVLLDLRLADMSAAEVITRIRLVSTTTRIVVFTAHIDYPAMKRALDAGACGGLLKDIGGSGLSAALRRILRGERVVDPRIVSDEARCSNALSCLGLTRREHEVLRRAAEGKTNPEIAESTGLTRNTVKTYLQCALHKLGARNRVEAITKAARLGLL